VAEEGGVRMSKRPTMKSEDAECGESSAPNCCSGLGS